MKGEYVSENIILNPLQRLTKFERVKDFYEGNAENSVKSMRFEVLRVVKMLILVFWVVTPCSTLKMKAICSSETLVTTCKKIQCHNPENQLSK
jgi:hypothetical protein